MGKNHGLNLVFILALAAMTLGGLGTAAMQQSFYWVPFIVNAGIFLLTGIREWRKFDDVRKAEKKADSVER